LLNSDLVVMGPPVSRRTSTYRSIELSQHETLAPLAVYYGSNASTYQSFAEDPRLMHYIIATPAETRILNSATKDIRTDRPVHITKSSYEGHPPDNAKD